MDRSRSIAAATTAVEDGASEGKFLSPANPARTRHRRPVVGRLSLLLGAIDLLGPFAEFLRQCLVAELSRAVNLRLRQNLVDLLSGHRLPQRAQHLLELRSIHDAGTLGIEDLECLDQCIFRSRLLVAFAKEVAEAVDVQAGGRNGAQKLRELLIGGILSEGSEENADLLHRKPAVFVTIEKPEVVLNEVALRFCQGRPRLVEPDLQLEPLLELPLSHPGDPLRPP
mmetsp:Transcript_79937/g.232055  ORF Transcript_79937/g.232055 Transcript_79937/m.232055 type:complete len:226 (+) Transcript_79937:163-840(+)